MAITKSGTRVTLTADGSDGYDWAHPYTMADILAASDAGGWGMTKQNNVYFIPFSIYNTANTYWTIREDNCITLIFTCTVPDDVYYINTPVDSHTRIGLDTGYNDIWTVRIIGDIDSIPSNNRRCYFAGDVEMVNTLWEQAYYGYFYGQSGFLSTARNCMFANCWFGVATGDYTILENVIKTGGYYGFQSAGTYSVDNVLIANSNNAILWSGDSGVWSNVKIQNCDNNHTMIRAGNGDKLATFIDCQIDKNKMTFYNSGSFTCLAEQELKTTFSIFVYDENETVLNNATVSVYGQDDTLLFTDVTDINGEIGNETIRYYYKWRQMAGGSQIDEGTTDYEPLKVVVSKSGYYSTIVPDIYITPGEKTTMRSVVRSIPPPEPEPLRITGLKVD